MAGNTKFIGFERDNKVVLERWGGKAVVDLGSPAPIEALRTACYKDLPKNPKQAQDGMITFRFDEDQPAIEAHMNAEQAKKLLAKLEVLQPDSGDDTVKWWIDELKEAIRQYQSYFDQEQEPGVSDV